MSRRITKGILPDNPRSSSRPKRRMYLPTGQTVCVLGYSGGEGEERDVTCQQQGGATTKKTRERRYKSCCAQYTPNGRIGSMEYNPSILESDSESESESESDTEAKAAAVSSLHSLLHQSSVAAAAAAASTVSVDVDMGCGTRYGTVPKDMIVLSVRVKRMRWYTTNLFC